MTTYKEIKGQSIKSVSTDPTNPGVGEIWYNNTIGVLKGYANIGGAWSSGGSLNTANTYAGAGTQTAAVGFVGSNTEEYDGSSWTATSSMNTARQAATAQNATQTAALAAGGAIGPTIQSVVEEYNGSTWT